MTRLFHIRRFITTALAVASLLGGALVSQAATLVVPNGLGTREGSGSSGIFDQTGREQTVYAATNFPAGPMSIYELRYRPNVTDYMPGNAFSATNLGLQIVLSTSSVQPGGLSPVFSDNTGSNAEVVVSGAVALSSLFIGPDTGPKVFDIVISLEHPFTYDPAQGNLLVDIQNFSGGPTSPVDAEYSTNAAASRLVSRSPFSPSGVRDDDADVLQIGYSQSGGTNPPTGPIIVSQPTNEIVSVGQTAGFSVAARGAAPLAYQWIFDGTNVLAGATNSSILLTNVQANEAGTYQVQVSNAAGGTNSVAATLTVPPFTVPGYICAVLRGDCADAPPPPRQVGAIVTGSNYVIMTVAYGDPRNWPVAQQIATDAAFESIMPQYCALPKTGCVTDSVQWNIITYDADGRPNTSGCAASGCQAHSCAGGAVPGYLCAVLRSDCTDSPPPPQQIGAIATGPGYVIMTVAYGDPGNWPAAQRIVTDAAFESIMPQYCALPKTGCVTDGVQWNIITYNTNGRPNTSGCAASGCQDHSCMEVGSGPPVIVGQPTNQVVSAGRSATFSVNATGVAPLSYQWIFDGTNILAGATNSSLLLTNVQANEAGTYGVMVANAAGGTNSIAATLTVTPFVVPGYICAVLRGDCADAPPPPPQVGAIVTGSNYVILTVAYGDPGNWPAAQQIATDAAFESIMPLYCALPKTGCVRDGVQWNIITYNTNGTPNTSGCAASGCQDHTCAEVGTGYICAVLRSDCTSAPIPPPPVGGTNIGPDYVIMTVANANPTNFLYARQIVTDAIFESLMPLYCGLPGNSGAGCVTNRVQWNIMTYDANGNPAISGCAASGCDYHYCGDGGPRLRSPMLSITPATNGIGLAWPSSTSDFILEASSNLVNWYAVNPVVNTNGGRVSAQMPAPAPAPGLFYRLRQK